MSILIYINIYSVKSFVRGRMSASILTFLESSTSGRRVGLNRRDRYRKADAPDHVIPAADR